MTDDDDKKEIDQLDEILKIAEEILNLINKTKKEKV